MNKLVAIAILLIVILVAGTVISENLYNANYRNLISQPNPKLKFTNPSPVTKVNSISSSIPTIDTDPV